MMIASIVLVIVTVIFFLEVAIEHRRQLKAARLLQEALDGLEKLAHSLIAYAEELVEIAEQLDGEQKGGEA